VVVWLDGVVTATGEARGGGVGGKVDAGEPEEEEEDEKTKAAREIGEDE
jgi:hypothetical protein